MSARLDLHEGISDAAAAVRLRSCPRWPKGLMLLSSRGALVQGRCRATNKCEYCARLAAVEWAEMFALDALDGDAPEVYGVLTTRSSNLDQRLFYESRRQVQRAILLRFPGSEFAWITEATTGRASTSGGVRRLHWNYWVKGVQGDDAAEVGRVAARIWCAREDARELAQWCGPITEMGGLMRYLALHFLKESQQLPIGWKGHRVTATRGYFTDERWRLRARAQDALRVKREVYKAIHEGYEGNEAEIVAQARAHEGRQTRWELVKLTPDSLGQPLARTLQNREPRVLRPEARPAAVWVPELMDRQRVIDSAGPML